MTVNLCVCMRIEAGCGCVYVGCKLACVLTPPLSRLTTYQFLSSLVKSTLLPFRKSFWTFWEVLQPGHTLFITFVISCCSYHLVCIYKVCWTLLNFRHFLFHLSQTKGMNCLLLGFPMASARPWVQLWYCRIRTSRVWKSKRDWLSQLVHSTSEIMEHLFHLLRSIS